jgi:hypothetical protein
VEEDSITVGNGKIIVFIRENEKTIMRKLLYLAVMGFIISCGDNKSTDAATESAPVTPGIENTNGNMPDTSNTIPLNSTLPVDSSRLNDSLPR